MSSCNFDDPVERSPLIAPVRRRLNALPKKRPTDAFYATGPHVSGISGSQFRLGRYAKEACRNSRLSWRVVSPLSARDRRAQGKHCEYEDDDPDFHDAPPPEEMTILSCTRA